MNNRITDTSLGALLTEYAQYKDGEYKAVLTDTQQHMIDFGVLTDTTKYLNNVLPEFAKGEIAKRKSEHARRQLQRLFDARMNPLAN